MADVVEDIVSGPIEKGVERIASRKSLTSQDLTVLLLHQQSRNMARVEKGMERLENGMNLIAGEIGELRRELVPLLDQTKNIADIRARMERVEAKLA